MNEEIALIVHNIRSAYNVGSMIRTAEGLGIKKVFVGGYSPYPRQKDDERLPHIAKKVHERITKTSLGAEEHLNIDHFEHIDELMSRLKKNGYKIIGLEQADGSIPLSNCRSRGKLALIVGEEVNGLAPALKSRCDFIVEIPMKGQKESFNVATAAAIALYHLSNEK